MTTASVWPPKQPPAPLHTLVRTLLDRVHWLEDAVEPSGGSGGAARTAHRAPAALDVVTLLADIDGTTVTGLRACGYIARIDSSRSVRITLWSSGAQGRWRHMGPQYLDGARRHAVRWTERADAILTPDKQVIETRAQPCPSCGKRVAMVWHDDLAEEVQRPSLYLDTASLTVVCRCCGLVWDQTRWGLLRRMLETV
jgi:hypothetical protein